MSDSILDLDSNAGLSRRTAQDTVITTTSRRDSKTSAFEDLLSVSSKSNSDINREDEGRTLVEKDLMELLDEFDEGEDDGEGLEEYEELEEHQEGSDDGEDSGSQGTTLNGSLDEVEAWEDDKDGSGEEEEEDLVFEVQDFGQ